MGWGGLYAVTVTKVDFHQRVILRVFVRKFYAKERIHLRAFGPTCIFRAFGFPVTLQAEVSLLHGVSSVFIAIIPYHLFFHMYRNSPKSLIQVQKEKVNFFVACLPPP